MTTDLYTEKQRVILERVDAWIRSGGAERSVRIAKQSDIIKAFQPWSEIASAEFLRTREFRVLFVRTLDEEDFDEPYYIFVTPNQTFFWPDGTAWCPHCMKSGEADCSASSYGYYDIPRRIDDIPYHGKRMRLTAIMPRYRCKHCESVFSVSLDSFAADDEPAFSRRHIMNIRKATMTKRSFESIAYDMCVSAGTVNKCFEEEVESRRPYKCYAPAHIGIGRATVNVSDGPRSYVVLLDIGEKEEKDNGVLAMESIRLETESVKEMLQRLAEPAAVQTITMDLHIPYRDAAKAALPHARIIADPLCLVRDLSRQTARVAGELYARISEELEEALRLDPDAAEYVSLHEPMVSEREFQALVKAFHIDDVDEMRRACIVPMTLSPREYLRQRLAILKNGNYIDAFLSRSDELEKSKAVRVCTLLLNFREFRNLYKIRDRLSHRFFMAPNAEAARKVADTARGMVPSGPEYNALRAYFRILDSEEWGEYVYAYFEDPVKGRHTNAALGKFYQVVKEINAVSRGRSWHKLKAKILFGNLSTPRRKTVAARRGKKDCAAEVMEFLDGRFDHYKRAVPMPSLDTWRVVFAIPEVRETICHWNAYVEDTAKTVEEICGNPNKAGSVIGCLRQLGISFPSAYTGNHADDGDACQQPIILPFRFGEWEENREQYLAMIASDLRFLARLGKST